MILQLVQLLPFIAGVRGGEDDNEAWLVPQEVLRLLQVQDAARLLQLHRGTRRRRLLQGLLPPLLGTRSVSHSVGVAGITRPMHFKAVRHIRGDTAKGSKGAKLCDIWLEFTLRKTGTGNPLRTATRPHRCINN